MERTRVRAVFSAGGVALVLALAACSPGQGSAGQQAPQAAGRSGSQPGSPAGGPGQAGRFGGITVQVASAQQGQLQATHQAAGTVVPVTQSAVAAQVSGVVARIVHQAGDWVQAGVTVVQLDLTPFNLAVENAQAAVKNAQINLQIGQYNVDQSGPRLQANVVAAQATLAAAQKNLDAVKAELAAGGSSRSSVDSAQSQLQQAQAAYDSAMTALDQNNKASQQTIAQLQLAVDQATINLQQAQLNLANASIKAPFAGQVVTVNVNPGEYVNASTAAFGLASAAREIQFGVPPADAPALRAGFPVRFTSAGQSWNAVVDQAPTAPVGGVVPLFATIVGGAGPSFGVVGTISYTLPLASGVLVPIASLQTNGSQNFVSVVSGGKVANEVVTVVAETDTQAAVTGVSAGAQVVVSPPPGLLPGASVQVVAASPANPSGAGAVGVDATATQGARP